MATIAQPGRPSAVGDERFFMIAAILMTFVLVAGFSLQLGMGRSTFASPLPVHAHALLFFGWTTLYLLQNGLVASGRTAIHRRLGWLSAIWIPAMVAAGLYVTVAMVRRGAVPFFFEPAYFLFMDGLFLLAFAGLAVAAIVKRRQTQWHRRLMFCGMAILTGPGWGRLLPAPLLIPWAGEVTFAMVTIFPIAGMIADLRRSGKVHPAWWWGIGTIAVTQIAVSALTVSAPGRAIYRMVTDGAPGAALPPNAYPPLPPV
jgi:hypothetical protein